MKLIDSLKRSGRSLRQAKIRTLLTASAIGVGTFALTMTLAASNGAQAFVDNIIAENFDPAELIVANDESVTANGGGSSSKPREYDDNFGSSINEAGVAVRFKQLADKDLERLEQVDGVSEIRQSITPSIQYVSGPNNKKFVGTAFVFSPAQQPNLLAGNHSGALKNKELLLPEAYLKPLGYTSAGAAVGNDIRLVVRKSFDINAAQAALAGPNAAEALTQTIQPETKPVDFKIVGVYKAPVTAQPGTESVLYIGLKDAQELDDYAKAGTPEYRKYTYAFVKVAGGEDATRLAEVQGQIKSLGYQATSIKDTQEFLNQIIAVLRGIVAAFGAIAVIASVFGIVNTMYISVLQRTREIGLMKALGMRKREIGRLFRLEAAWIGFLGGLLGSLAAVALGTALNPWITEKLTLGDGQRLLIFKPEQIILLIIALIIIAIVAGLLPARKAAKLNPIEALRTE